MWVRTCALLYSLLVLVSSLPTTEASHRIIFPNLQSVEVNSSEWMFTCLLHINIWLWKIIKKKNWQDSSICNISLHKHASSNSTSTSCNKTTNLIANIHVIIWVLFVIFVTICGLIYYILIYLVQIFYYYLENYGYPISTWRLYSSWIYGTKYR